MVLGKLCLAALILVLSPAPATPAENLHTQAATCRRQSAEVAANTECWYLCTECHEPTPSIHPLKIYEEGDSILCLRCHESKTYQENNKLLLNLVPNRGNHPVRILYDPEKPRAQLKLNPQGPLLFLDADGRNPKVHCSTCHNPMGDTPKLLWISNQRSALCLACHDK